ncbi:cell wall-binding repeat-containing protein [Clostridium peptidivorans]|uniref:cell wall-binding repeat-containing protein n=1 Tax=Clostridium peptidivorans TaxID=100174 RepID=UPI000BE3848C|nr:cell wall-binding repeat-containing protein [Clostridium peptidivorans]
MKKRNLKTILGITVAGLIISTSFNFLGVKAASVVRVGGSNRYLTAQDLAKQTFGTSTNVILVNGEGFADAVSATPLAKQLNAPVLLTEAKTLSSGVLNTIKALKATNVYIVGGNGVVSADIEAALKKEGLNVTRYGSATGTRYTTNAIVAKEVIKKAGVKKAFLVNGALGYADALSVSSIAAAMNIPVLITSATSIDPDVKKVIADNNLEIMGVGGAGVLPDTILRSANGTRVAQGKNRFETNVNVLTKYKSSMSLTKMYVAAGGSDSKAQFADALVASAAAAKDGSMVVLSGLGAGSADITRANSFIGSTVAQDTQVKIVGGTGVITKAIESQINAAVAEATGDLEVISIE